MAEQVLEPKPSSAYSPLTTSRTDGPPPQAARTTDLSNMGGNVGGKIGTVVGSLVGAIVGFIGGALVGAVAGAISGAYGGMINGGKLERSSSRSHS